MNKARRKQIEKIIKKLEGLQEEIESIHEGVEGVQSEEQEAFDNIPENLQGSERYETAEAAVDAPDSAEGGFDEVTDALESIIDYLNEAMGEA